MSAQQDNAAQPIEFTGCRPVLLVSDLQRSLRFYVDKLGFTEGWGLTDRIMNPRGQDRVTFCYVFCSNLELLLREVGSPHPSEIVVGCGSRDKVDRAFQEYGRRGAPIDEPPQERPWGTYEMYVRDPDGNLLRVLH